MLIAACSNKIKLSKRKFLFLLMIAFVVLWFNFTRWREQVLNYAPETSTKDSFQTTVLERVQCSLKAHQKVIIYVKMYYSVHQGVSVSGKCYRSIKIFHKTSNCWIVHLQLFPSLSNTFPYSYNVHKTHTHVLKWRGKMSKEKSKTKTDFVFQQLMLLHLTSSYNHRNPLNLPKKGNHEHKRWHKMAKRGAEILLRNFSHFSEKGEIACDVGMSWNKDSGFVLTMIQHSVRG